MWSTFGVHPVRLSILTAFIWFVSVNSHCDISSLSYAKESFKIFHEIYNSALSSQPGTEELNISQNGEANISHVCRTQRCDEEEEPSTKKELRRLCDEGRVLGLRASNLRTDLSALMSKLDPSFKYSGNSEEQLTLRKELLNKHCDYNTVIGELKILKARIEHIRKVGSNQLSNSHK